MKRLTVLFALICASVTLGAQTIKVEGTVLDNEEYPLYQAAVMEKGTTNGVITDFDGRYSIEVPQDAVLVFFFQGFIHEVLNCYEKEL